MNELNLLSNGRFLQDLSNWTAVNAVYNAGDGDDHYGVAVLSTGGGYISQTFTVPRTRLFTFHISVKAVGANLASTQCQFLIKDGSGNTVITQNLTGAIDVWTENTVEVGLATGTTYTFLIINNNAAGSVKIDDVWIWFLPMTRANIAARVAEKLGRLADDRSLSTTLSGSRTEGDYTYAIDSALRNIGAINQEIGTPDIRYLTAESLQLTIDEVEREMIEMLQRDYALEVDVTVGQRRENLSQIGTALGNMAGGNSKGGKVVMRKMSYPPAEDFNP